MPVTVSILNSMPRPAVIRNLVLIQRLYITMSHLVTLKPGVKTNSISTKTVAFRFLKNLIPTKRLG